MSYCSLAKIRTLVFDLEDSLFNKADWLLPAIEGASAAGNLDGQRAVDLASEYIQQRGCADAGLYNHILLGLGQSDSVLNIKAFIERIKGYRAAPGSLGLLPGVSEAVTELAKYYQLGITSVGDREIQRNKTTVLGLSSIFSDISIEEDKPELRRVPALQRVLPSSLNRLSTRAAFTLYVADNPFKDFVAARDLGMMTVRVLTGEYRDVEYPSLEHAADYDISSVARLPELMKLQPAARSRTLTAEEVGPLPGVSDLDTISGQRQILSIGN